MKKNIKYHYKSYDIYGEDFNDQRNFGIMNPYGYNLESTSRREVNNDINVLRTSQSSHKK